MRIKPVLAFLGAALVSTCALAEPSLPAAASTDANTVIVQGGAVPTIRLTPADVQEASGAFRLQDGRVLTLSSRSSKLFMELDGKRDELVPVSRTRFVARSSGDELALDGLRFPTAVTLTQMQMKP